MIRKDSRKLIEPRKLIAVNLDQTLCNTAKSLMLWHNRVYGTQLELSQFNTLDYWKVWGGTEQESCLKIREFYNSPEFLEIECIQDFSYEALKMLKSRGFKLVIITSRQQFVARPTKTFVDKFYKDIFESMYFCNLNLSDKERGVYISKSKATICREIGVDVLIEDSLNDALDCQGVQQILLYDHLGNYEWNHRSSLPNHVQRVFNWKQVMSHFPKPTSPLKQCIYSFEEDGDYFYDYQCYVLSPDTKTTATTTATTTSAPYEYETIEIEEESSDDEYDGTQQWPVTETICL